MAAGASRTFPVAFHAGACWFATLRERFATWIAVSNRNGSLGLAFPLLYVVRRGLH